MKFNLSKAAASLITCCLMASCCNTASECNTPVKSDTEVIENVMMARRSIRKYTDKKIDRAELTEILNCGINAPNGQNRQAYEIRVVDNVEMLSEITSAVLNDHPGMQPQGGHSNIFQGASCVVFIAHDTTYDISQVDCGLLGENIMLSAWARGIGSCTMAFPTRLMSDSPSCKPLIEKLGFSENYNLLYCIAMGYADEAPEAKPRQQKFSFVD